MNADTFIFDITLKAAMGLGAAVLALVVYSWKQLANKIDKLGNSAQRQFDDSNLQSTTQISNLREEINNRLRSMGHRNVDLAATVHDLILLFAQHTKDKDDENTLLKGMLKQAAKMEDPELFELDRKKKYDKHD